MEHYIFSEASMTRLRTVDIRLQMIFREALRSSPIDFGIPEYGGKREAEEQHQLFLDGKSQLDGYEKESYHQSGKAVDIYAYVGKASWDEKHLRLLAGHILGTAKRLGFELFWGGDWDRDHDYDDQTFNDLVHFELRD